MQETEAGGKPRIHLREQEWKRYLNKRGLTQAACAELLECNPSTLWRIELGGKPSSDFIAAVIDRLGLPFDSVFTVKAEVKAGGE